jgi:uroporphyrinogen III methyltransferase/synthase
LITLRGVQCLARADAILYDYLVNEDILRYAPADAEQICLGQHRRADLWSQQAINEKLVQLAAAGKTVVRLKGGDPMVFGHAAEELDALLENEIPFEIVPGVTAATAASCYLGVPITDRHGASAVALVTGQESSDKPRSALDYQALANFPGTLVIYMGVTTAARWAAALIEAGKPPDTPAWIVRRCTWPDQVSISCTLAEVPRELTPYNRIPPPVVVILGLAGQQHTGRAWFQRQPLFGVRILVTRAQHQNRELADRLAELGANVSFQAAITIDEPEDWEPVDRALDGLSGYDWLVFSSSNGVRSVLGRLLATGRDLRVLGGVKLAAIGPGTSRTLSEYHLRADVQPATFRAESLAELLTANARGRRFLLARANRGREILADQLRAAGGFVDQIIVYRSTDVTTPDATVLQNLRAGQIDWMTVSSSAIAKSLAAMFHDDLRKARLASISPITSQTLRELGCEPAAEAASYTIEGLVEAIVSKAARPR